MDNKQRIKILELSFNIMENLLLSKDFKDKDELMAVAKKGVDISNRDEKMPTELKMAYAEAYQKLDSLSWEEILEIKEIITD